MFHCNICVICLTFNRSLIANYNRNYHISTENAYVKYSLSPHSCATLNQMHNLNSALYQCRTHDRMMANVYGEIR